MKVRIGIDVGGTFTDAVAINDENYELISSVKIPTTHSAPEGVAAGIIQVLNKIMEECGIKTEDVVFIAHGTTQATNALLEGDVAKVGIITLGTGVQGSKSKSDTNIGNIKLAAGKNLYTEGVYVNTGTEELQEATRAAIGALQEKGAESFVVAEAFSVDNPENENAAVDAANAVGVPVTASNDVTKLYGLKVRTRTAVINASILPKMLDAANLTEQSILGAQIKAPLMVMRCDGGVMMVDEVRRRPILTILSGPAAGVAGALMYEKLTDGIFFEVGGTSTDISCVKDGNVMIQYAEVGGHKTYLNSLDVRTVGIGGGSMVEMKNGSAVDVGPRSAHIAGMEYEVYADEAAVANPVLKTVRPMNGDPEYAYVLCEGGARFALTLSGAANIAGYVPDGDYAAGNAAAARKAWEPLASQMGLTVEQAAEQVLQFAAAKNGEVVERMMKDYGLDRDALIFVGGGGGASVVVPHLARHFHCAHKIAKNAPVISPIGVALAMVRDMVERTIRNPTEADILALRHEAIQMAVKSGASVDSIDVQIEVDAQQHKVRAIAVGATELRTKSLGTAAKTDEELKEIVADNLKVSPQEVQLTADNGTIAAVCHERVVKHLLVFKRKTQMLRLIDRDGVIRLQKKNADVCAIPLRRWKPAVKRMIQEHTNYSDGGEEVPNIYVVLGGKIIDLSGMQSSGQILSLCETELSGAPEDETLILVSTLTTENERG